MPSSNEKRERQGHFERGAKIMAGALIVVPLLVVLVMFLLFPFFHAWH